MGKVLAPPSDHKYMQIAEGIEKMIHEEILRIGDKLPSVRVLSEEYGISMGTAFQAYYHLEGKGLGLYLVKLQAESLGGRVEVVSELNRGTTFTVYLPEQPLKTS